MSLIDITLTVNNALAVWPGDPSIHLERVSRMEDGGIANISRLDAGVHTGTHIDAPLHFIPHAPSVEALDLERFIGPCFVVELGGHGAITAAELEAADIPATERLLLKTSNSRFWEADPSLFHEDFRAPDGSAAQWIVERGIKLIGIDYLSIEPFHHDPDFPTHHILLSAHVAVVEGLKLGHVAQGHYRLMCLPLKLEGSDGAPARAVLETV